MPTVDWNCLIHDKPIHAFSGHFVQQTLTLEPGPPSRGNSQRLLHDVQVSPNPPGSLPLPHDSAQRIFNQRCTRPAWPHTPISASRAASNRTALASTAGGPSRSTTSSAKPSDILCSAASRGIPRLSR